MRLFFLFLLICNLSVSQQKIYRFPLVDGSKMMTMSQMNELTQETSRFLSYKIIKNEKKEDLYHLGSFLLHGFLLHPLTHEEGHRSVLTHLNIGSVSQPIVDSKGVARVIGVSDNTLKTLRDNDLPNYIRLHTAGLESDFMYLNSLNRKLTFEDEEYKYVKADIWARNIGVISYYLTSLFYRKFSVTEEANETKRDIVGHDIWGMSRHIHRPNMEFHRYTTWAEMTSQERKFANRTAFLSVLNLVNPNLFGIQNFKLKSGNKIGFNIGYSLSPFGDYLTQNVYYYDIAKDIKINPYFIEYFNNEKMFLAGGLNLYNYKLTDNILINSLIEAWAQPKNYDFFSRENFYGIGGKLNVAYKLMSFKEENKLFFDLGIVSKTEGFMAGVPSLKNHLGINVGIIYVLNNQ